MASLHADLATHGLGVVDASVLLVIEDNPGTTQSAIGRTLATHRANMAPIAAKLARLKLTTSEPAGRASLLRLTARGTRVAGAVRAAMRENDDRFLAHLGAAERERLTLWLEAIRQTDDRD